MDPRSLNCNFDLYKSQIIQKFMARTESVNALMKQIKPLTWLVGPNSFVEREAIVGLVLLKTHEAPENAVAVKSSTYLSKNNRFACPRKGDILTAVTIQCIHPSDIKEITLYGCVQIPSDPQIQSNFFSGQNCDTSKFNIFGEENNPNRPIKLIPCYIPLKTFTSNTNTFKIFDYGLHLEQFMSFSFEVHWNRVLGIDHPVVQFDWLFIQQEMRQKFMDIIPTPDVKLTCNLSEAKTKNLD